MSPERSSELLRSRRRTMPRLDTWDGVKAAAKRYVNPSGVTVDYFEVGYLFGAQLHGEPVQHLENAYFVESVDSYVFANNVPHEARVYRVCRISDQGKVDRYPFDVPGSLMDITREEDAFILRDEVVKNLRKNHALEIALGEAGIEA
jgi:hypothetical protein